MFPVIMVLTANIPAFAPVPVLRESIGTSVTGEVERVRTDHNTISLKCKGKETVFKVARDARVTMNGQKGYSLDDVGDATSTPTVTLTIKNGVAESLDVTLTLRKGETLCRPGMSPVQILRRKLEAARRERDEQQRQGN